VAKTDPLAQLKDIHLPDPVGWWPLAPGWYLLLFLGLCLTIALFCFINKRRRHALAKNQAIALLNTYEKLYEEEQNTALTSSLISELLRRVALTYYPRTEVASLHGDAWLHFLNQTSKGIEFDSVREALLDAPFKTECHQDLKLLFHKARLWIKQRKVPCSN